MQEAQILQALVDEEISANPLDEEKIQSINNYCGLTVLGEPDQPDGDQAQVGLEPGDQALINEAALDYDLDMDGAQVGDGEPLEVLDQQMADQEEPIENEPEEFIPEQKPKEELDLVSAAVEEAASHADEGESVLAGINFDSDDDLLDSEVEASASSAM